MEESQIKHIWQTYFHKFLNEEGDGNIMLGELGHSESHRDFKYCRRIKVEEIVGAMRKMSRGKATGPDEILVEFLRYMGRADLEWLTGLSNIIFATKRMPDELRYSDVMLGFRPVVSASGLFWTITLWTTPEMPQDEWRERFILRVREACRVREGFNTVQRVADGLYLRSHKRELVRWIGSELFASRFAESGGAFAGVCLGKLRSFASWFDGVRGRRILSSMRIFVLREREALTARLVEKYMDRKKGMVLIDLEKGYGKVLRDVLWKCLKVKGVPVAYIRAIKDMYDGAMTHVRTALGDSEIFLVVMGLHCTQPVLTCLGDGRLNTPY
ncbi:PREDICTED: uncharacterized protein LOC109233607 [Nicotiana attenuata]|uniref:uncharacterized protein LOC109233607 n=1 Tax=Nicotiana attenuata TaxID=49451 RepID=UPI000904D056|nr:PREDICTED: uncharacterized protein LOC109233607 [Nicotiana attenuata]